MDCCGIIKNNKLFLGKTSFGYPAEQRVVLTVFFRCKIHGIIRKDRRIRFAAKNIFQTAVNAILSVSENPGRQARACLHRQSGIWVKWKFCRRERTDKITWKWFIRYGDETESWGLFGDEMASIRKKRKEKVENLFDFLDSRNFVRRNIFGFFVGIRPLSDE